MIEDWKYRKKGDRIVIECNRKFKCYLPKDARECFDALKGLRPALNGIVASNSNEETDKNNPQKFAQSLLNEVNKQDANLPEIEGADREFIMNGIKEASKKLWGDYEDRKKEKKT